MDLDLRALLGSPYRLVSIDEGEGGSGGAPAPDPTNAPGGHVITKEPAADTVPKAEADRREKQARKDAEKALLAQFGENASVDAIKAVLDKQKADEDARKDAATKAREAADAEKAAAATERQAAARERVALKVQMALLAANVKPDRLTDAAQLVKVADDADDEAIKAAVEARKTSTPEWFPAPGVVAPSGVPGTGQKPHQNQPDDLAEARQRGERWRERRTGESEDPFKGFRRIS